ncbi:NAD(P)H-dependent oxidoreductase [Actinospica sp.]|jgi:NAD(P)H-dependent FMN reductase|uniref:NADPH-dependent FMN reductase n=1 Tax=Actinospica sp. TaxID=1872142 RepID=UPI002CC63043|nr:NAD(P)H-dependent oxidoreductase [Actinospica sp.]HWG25586.1 NAD(P)H-dependent oxidoreductase [Actinospica sp.]
MSKPVLQIIVGSTRPGRVGTAVAEWFQSLAVKHDAFAPLLIELADMGLPLYDEPKPPRLGKYVHEHTRRWSQTVLAADAFVFVVPEYNHGYNAATKNALDFLHNEWRGKPVGFVSYGAAAAGARAVQGLLPVVAALGMLSSGRAVTIPQIARAVRPGEPYTGNERADEGAALLLDELSTFTELLAGRKPKSTNTE